MKILIKGAGDLATGIGHRLYQAGHVVWMTDLSIPTAVRRSVSFCSAILKGSTTIEGVTAIHSRSYEQCISIAERGEIPILADPKADIRMAYQPDVVIDAIMAKENTGTTLKDAGYVIGIGPGFTAQKDCHCVIETKRGHYLGKVIKSGTAIPNTGIPGNVGGYTVERLIKANGNGVFKPLVNIGEFVTENQNVAQISQKYIVANISGIVRGMLQEGVQVKMGMKVGDIDARCKEEHCYTISDKARAIGGGALEAVSAYEHRI